MLSHFQPASTASSENAPGIDSGFEGSEPLDDETTRAGHYFETIESKAVERTGGSKDAEVATRMRFIPSQPGKAEVPNIDVKSDCMVKRPLKESARFAGSCDSDDELDDKTLGDLLRERLGQQDVVGREDATITRPPDKKLLAPSKTDLFRRLEEHPGVRAASKEDQWVQCDTCEKWRRVLDTARTPPLARSLAPSTFGSEALTSSSSATDFSSKGTILPPSTNAAELHTTSSPLEEMGTLSFLPVLSDHFGASTSVDSSSLATSMSASLVGKTFTDPSDEEHEVLGVASGKVWAFPTARFKLNPQLTMHPLTNHEVKSWSYDYVTAKISLNGAAGGEDVAQTHDRVLRSKKETLGLKWYCSMNLSDPNHCSCDAPEEPSFAPNLNEGRAINANDRNKRKRQRRDLGNSNTGRPLLSSVHWHEAQALPGGLFSFGLEGSTGILRLRTSLHSGSEGFAGASTVVDEEAHSKRCRQQLKILVADRRNDSLPLELLRTNPMQHNPTKLRSARWQRYDKYRQAKTLGEAKILGASFEDLVEDLNNGTARFVEDLFAHESSRIAQSATTSGDLGSDRVSPDAASSIAPAAAGAGSVAEMHPCATAVAEGGDSGDTITNRNNWDTSGSSSRGGRGVGPMRSSPRLRASQNRKAGSSLPEESHHNHKDDADTTTTTTASNQTSVIPGDRQMHGPLDPSDRESVLKACAYFRDLDSSVWFLNQELVRPELQHVYCRDNLSKHGAQSFHLSPRVTSLLSQGADEIRRDWDTYLRQSHPGFSSYGSTLGDHDDSEQERHTRVVGPSVQHWEAFRRRYRGWFNEVCAEVQLLMAAEIAKHYSADKAQRKAHRRAARRAQRHTGSRGDAPSPRAISSPSAAATLASSSPSASKTKPKLSPSPRPISSSSSSSPSSSSSSSSSAHAAGVPTSTSSLASSPATSLREKSLVADAVDPSLSRGPGVPLPRKLRRGSRRLSEDDEGSDTHGRYNSSDDNGDSATISSRGVTFNNAAWPGPRDLTQADARAKRLEKRLKLNFSSRDSHEEVEKDAEHDDDKEEENGRQGVLDDSFGKRGGDKPSVPRCQKKRSSNDAFPPTSPSSSHPTHSRCKERGEADCAEENSGSTKRRNSPAADSTPVHRLKLEPEGLKRRRPQRQQPRRLAKEGGGGADGDDESEERGSVRDEEALSRKKSDGSSKALGIGGKDSRKNSRVDRCWKVEATKRSEVNRSTADMPGNDGASPVGQEEGVDGSSTISEASSSEESDLESDEREAIREFEADAKAEFLLPCELHDMHILRQVSSASLGGAVFDDHQDRHGEVNHNTPFRWTVTLLAHSTGPPTGFFMWNSRARPSTAEVSWDSKARSQACETLSSSEQEISPRPLPAATAPRLPAQVTEDSATSASSFLPIQVSLPFLLTDRANPDNILSEVASDSIKNEIGRDEKKQDGMFADVADGDNELGRNSDGGLGRACGNSHSIQGSSSDTSTTVHPVNLGQKPDEDGGSEEQLHALEDFSTVRGNAEMADTRGVASSVNIIGRNVPRQSQRECPVESTACGDDGTTSLTGVIPYPNVGSAVMFPSLAWHRSVIPAKEHWPFEALKFTFFFAEPTERERRYHLKKRVFERKEKEKK